jgi:hypothetical protein
LSASRTPPTAWRSLEGKQNERNETECTQMKNNGKKEKRKKKNETTQNKTKQN